LKNARLITDLSILFTVRRLLKIGKIEEDDSSHEQHLVFNSGGCGEIQDIVVVLGPDLRAEASSSLEGSDLIECGVKDIECRDITGVAWASRTTENARLAWIS